MEYSDYYLREYLPPENPPMELVPGDVIDEIELWGDFLGEDRELIARSTFWTYAIFSELGLGLYRSEYFDPPFWMGLPWLSLAGAGVDLRNVSFGLFDKDQKKLGSGSPSTYPSGTGRNFTSSPCSASHASGV